MRASLPSDIYRITDKRLLEMLKTRLYKEQTVLEETKQSHINEIVKASKKTSFVLDGKKVFNYRNQVIYYGTQMPRGKML